MSDQNDDTTDKPAVKGDDKSARLAEALRANLGKRKAQKRARNASGERDTEAQSNPKRHEEGS